ncbi:hypothetical protein EPYR_01974 [Erwinia pyrifoliae DSM 12163]|nr:hypothetical protein EPYR_01974 [Erwinia pyrifoliae DSM 12163]
MGSNTDEATDAWFNNHVDLNVETFFMNLLIKYGR